MAVAINPNQPAVVVLLVGHFLVKLGERRESKLDALVMEVLSLPAPWIPALALLPLVCVVGRGLSADAKLPVPDVRDARGRGSIRMI